MSSKAKVRISTCVFTITFVWLVVCTVPGGLFANTNPGLVSKVKKPVVTTVNNVKATADSIDDMFADLKNTATTATQSAAEDVKDAAETLVDKTVDGVKDTAETVSDQGEVVKEEAPALVIIKMVKSSKAFATTSNYSRPGKGMVYSPDLSTHHTFAGAVKNAMAVQPAGQAVKGSIKGTTHPITLLGHFAAPACVEAYRQATEDKKFDGKKLRESVDPIKTAGAAGGVVVADAAGAAIQAGLGSVGGGWGQVAGFVARPVITWSGYYLGRNFGGTVKEGKPSLKGAVADTLREVNPVKLTTTAVSTTVGGVVGQALIPVPVVGYVVGSTVGGIVGSTAGNVLGKHGPLAGMNKNLIAWQHRRADDLEGKKPWSRTEVVDIDTKGGIETKFAWQK